MTVLPPTLSVSGTNEQIKIQPVVFTTVVLAPRVSESGDVTITPDPVP